MDNVLLTNNLKLWIIVIEKVNEFFILYYFLMNIFFLINVLMNYENDVKFYLNIL